MRERLEPASLPDGLCIPTTDWPQILRSVRGVIGPLLQRLQALERRLHQDSSHSSRPPSTGAPSHKRQCRTQAVDRRKPEGESLWVWLDVPGVASANNVVERVHQCGVLLRKRSQGTGSEQGNRWVEPGLSVRPTGRSSGRPTFPVLVEAVAYLLSRETSNIE